jgi:LEA14-like dessication related protein
MDKKSTVSGGNVRVAVQLARVSVVSLLVVSCATLQRLTFEEPTVDLVAVQITGLGLTGGAFNLLVDVYNPNSYEIRTARVEAALDLEETHFGDAYLEEAVVLPPTSHTEVEIPVSFTYRGVGAAARGLLMRGAVNYALETRLLANTPLGERSLSFRNRGQVPIRELIR